MSQKLSQNLDYLICQIKRYATKQFDKPLIIEFAGSPKAGKSTAIESLRIYLKRQGYNVKIIDEFGRSCPIDDKYNPLFNVWTVCKSLLTLIEECVASSFYDVVIFDRAIFDSLCWFEWMHITRRIEQNDKNVIESFLLLNTFTSFIDIVFCFTSLPEISLEREYKNTLTNQDGRIMNTTVLAQYLQAINSVKDKVSHKFNKVVNIDTTTKNIYNMNLTITNNIVQLILDRTVEKIGCIQLDKQKQAYIQTIKFTPFSNFKISSTEIIAVNRVKAEENPKYIQIVPIVVLYNRQNKLIVSINKNKKILSSKSPEKNKSLLYLGGHLSESEISSNTGFIEITKKTLIREIKEEIGLDIISDQLDDNPYIIFCPDYELNKVHIAICYFRDMDFNIIGSLNSRSNYKLEIKSFNEIDEGTLDSWSKEIYKYFETQ